jgi:hypothetical protein
VANPDGSYSVLAHHTYAEESSPAEPYAIEVAIRHDALPVVTAGAMAQVADAPVQVIRSEMTLTVAEGQDTGLVTLATFADPGGPEDVADYGATVDWGDHTPRDTAPLIVANSDGTYSVQDHHVYAEESGAARPESNPYRIAVAIMHDAAPAAHASDTAAIFDPAVQVGGSPPALSAMEGQDSGPLKLATFTDPAGLESRTSYSAAVSWGDGTAQDTTTPVIVDDHDGTYSVQAHHTYLAESIAAIAGTNPYQVTVSIHHLEAPIATATATVSVVDPSVVLTQDGLAVPATESVQAGFVKLATFSDPGGLESPFLYSAVIDWGDGTPLDTTSAVIAVNADGTYSLLGSHTYREESDPARQDTNPYTIVVSISHGEAIPTSAVSMGVVADQPVEVISHPAALAPVEGEDTGPVTLATFHDPAGLEDLSHYRASVDWGDGTPPDSSTPILINNRDGTVGVQAHHIYALDSDPSNPGSTPYQIVVTLNNDNSPATTTGATATVGDQQITATATATTVFDTTPFSGVVASFTDDFAGASAGQFAATIDWGDGNTSDGTIAVSGSGASAVFAVAGGHSYAGDGDYVITVSINDTGGATVMALGTISVMPAAIPAAVSAGSLPVAPASAGQALTVTPPAPVVIAGVVSNSATGLTAAVVPTTSSLGQGPALVVPAGPLRGTLTALAGRIRAHPSAHRSGGRQHGAPGIGDSGLGIVGGLNLGPLAVAGPAPAAATSTAVAATAAAAAPAVAARSTSTASNSRAAQGTMAPTRFAGALQTTITVLAIYNVQFRGSRTATVASFRSRRHRR